MTMTCLQSPVWLAYLVVALLLVATVMVVGLLAVILWTEIAALWRRNPR